MGLGLGGCPFCGETKLVSPETIIKLELTISKIICAKCGASGPISLDGEVSAALKWNTRHNEDRTIVLPAPIGTQIFIPYRDLELDGTLDEGVDDQLQLIGYRRMNDEDYYITGESDDLRKDEFFLTRGAAETALEAMKKEDR